MVQYFQLFLDVIFNQDRCSLCRKPGIYSSRRPWCRQCQQELKDLSHIYPICETCGKYLCEAGNLCADCRQNPPPFSIARSVGPYEGGFRIAIKVYKFMGRRHLARKMGSMMAAVVKQEERFWPIDLIIAVPISRQSLCDRGFDQTEILAEIIGRQIRRPVARDLLYRCKERPGQRELSKEEREQNLLDAFQVREPQKVYNRSVLLVDDVYTTGSTVRECARALLKAGAARVVVVTWAGGKGF